MTPRKPRTREGETRKTCMTPGILRPGDRFTIETRTLQGSPVEYTAQAVELTDEGILIKLLPREQNA